MSVDPHHSSRPPEPRPDRLVFGFAPSIEGDRTRQALIDFCRALSESVGLEVAPMRVSSYDALERALASGSANLGWFPPVVLARLMVAGHAIPIAQCVRAGAASYHACLFAAEGASFDRIADIRGARVAWVDRSSAAGYVFPRLMLAAAGVDPAIAFSQQTFLGSHAEVVRAVVGGAADIGATFVSRRGDGTIARGGWTDPDGTNPRPIKILATFGPIPNDAMAVRTELPADLRTTLANAAISAASQPYMRGAIRHLLGADSLAPVTERAFDELRVLVGNAMSTGARLTE